jgi:hypothetical protein
MLRVRSDPLEASGARTSLDNGTKLVRPPRTGRWVFRLCPEAGEGGGSFRSAVASRSPGPFIEPAADSQADAVRRARGKVRRYCAANQLNRLGTLTYAGAGNRDPVQLRDDIGRFFRRLRSDGQAFPYLWVPEWHPGGHGLHVHFAVGRFIPVGAIKRSWGHGFVHITLLGDLPVGSGTLGEARLAARYLAKYLGKDVGATAAGLHRYEVAEGFQPQTRTISTDSAGEALGWASVAMAGPPNHVWWWTDEPEWAGPPAVWASWD